MSYPVLFSINKDTITNKGFCQKTFVDRTKYSKGFVSITCDSVKDFADAIGPGEDTNGAGFSFAVFKGGHRRRDNHHMSYGIGLDFDKITDLETGEVLMDECRRRLPSLSALLSSRVGPFIRMVYLSQSCPEAADFVMGRVILTFERGLSWDDAKALGSHLTTILKEDFPNCVKATLNKIGLDGGIDEGAIKDPCRFWAGIKCGREALFISEENPPIPNALIDSWVGEGRSAVPYQRLSSDGCGGEAASKRLALDPATLEVFDTIIRHILKPSANNTYDSVYRWIKTFVQQVSPSLDEAFCYWMERSPYRMQTIGFNPQEQIYRTSQMDFAYLGVIMKAIRTDSPNWVEEYLELVGEYPHFTSASDLDEEQDIHNRMSHHPSVALGALKALGLK